MKIREAKLSDASAIARVNVDTWRSTYHGILPEEYLAGLSYSEFDKHWQNILTDPEHDRTKLNFVAEEESIVAFASGGSERTNAPQFQGEIYAIYVLSDSQRRGTGKQLMQQLVQSFLASDWQSVLVWVLAENPSRKFYDTLGAKQTRTQQIEIGGNLYEAEAYGWENISVIST
jgi:ribosomal protein S18 acetylase RimI-like enzyme